MAKASFREQVLQAREDAIVTSVNRLLAEKGFDTMTVDDVVSDVGIARASLYKHFTSKEELAAAAMVKVLDRALVELSRLRAEVPDAFKRLEGVVRWAYLQQLAGEMPLLPARNSSLRGALIEHKPYVDRLMQLSDELGAWIVEAQAAGHISARLPAELVLYMLFARACDPVLGVARASGANTDAQIVDWLVETCMKGLA